MRRKYFNLIVLFLIPLTTFSQSDIYIGKPYAVVDAARKYYFHHANEILAVKIQGERVTLQKFDAENLTLLRIKVYDDLPQGYLVEKVMKFNNRFFLFYSSFDKRNELEQLFFREIDFGGAAFIGKGERIIKVNKRITTIPAASGDYPVRYGFGDVETPNKFDFQPSFDESKILIQYRIKPYIKSDDRNFDIIGMTVFDKNLDYVWNSEVKMPYTEKKMDNLDYAVDAEGNSYILASVYNDHTTDIRKDRNGKPNYHIELLRIKAHTAEIDITPIEIEDKFINKIWLYETIGNEMVCAGFYNRGKDPDNSDGIILFRIGKEGAIYDIAQYEIPVKVLNQYESVRTQKRNEKKDMQGYAEFEDLQLREMKIATDGSITLVGEQYFVKEHTYYSYGRTRTNYTYHYNDILVTKIDPEGNLKWMEKLPKRQVGRNGKGGMSYEYMFFGNHHYFLFLDHPRNMILNLNLVPTEHTDGAGGFLTGYKIDDKTGEVDKISILDTRDVKGMELYQFSPGRIVPLSAKDFVFEAYKKRKEDILVRVGLNK